MAKKKITRKCITDMTAAEKIELHGADGRIVGVEVEDLTKIGPVVITECGEENMYFTVASGIKCYCKCF